MIGGEILSIAYYGIVSISRNGVTAVAERHRSSPSSDRFDRQGKDVTDAALRADDMGRAGIGLELASQPQDLHVDAAVEHILVNAGRLQKVLAGKRPQRRVEKGDQQGVFALGQRDGG